MKDRVTLTGKFDILRNSHIETDLVWSYDVDFIPETTTQETSENTRNLPERNRNTENLPKTFSDGRNNPYEVRIAPLRLSLQSQTGSIFTSPTAIGYSATSLDQDFFLSFEQNGTTTLYDAKNGSTDVFDFAENSLQNRINRVKRLNATDYLVFHTDADTVFLYKKSEKTLSPLAFYDDVEVTRAGKMIALVRANSTKKREILGIENETGDVLYDITEVGVPKILKR